MKINFHPSSLILYPYFPRLTPLAEVPEEPKYDVLPQLPLVDLSQV
jgi:hypothetical protein